MFSFVKPGLILKSLPVDQVHRSISPFFLRRTLETALPELPDPNRQTIELELEGDQLHEYERVWDDRTRHHANHGAFLAILTRLEADM